MRRLGATQKPLERVQNEVFSTRIPHQLTTRNFKSSPVLNPESICQVNKRVYQSSKAGFCLFSTVKREKSLHHSGRKRRTRFDYMQNYSAALVLPYTKKELEEKQAEPHQLLSMSKAQVIEHANRRVDLLFYTFVAYYNSGRVVTRDRTDLQHGRGRNAAENTKLTEACHSSLTPSLKDRIVRQSKDGYLSRKNLLSGTHLRNNLNATVELPHFINQFDDKLEHICNKGTIKILNDVSFGKMNPIEGLGDFLIMMRNILNNMKQQAKKNNSLLAQHSTLIKTNIHLQLIDLVMEGTLSTTFSRQTGKVHDDYIQLMLRMTSEEKAMCEKTPECKKAMYIQKITEIKNEILQEKSNLRGHFI